jgi:hypothetical protein
MRPAKTAKALDFTAYTKSKKPKDTPQPAKLTGLP